MVGRVRASVGLFKSVWETGAAGPYYGERRLEEMQYNQLSLVEKVQSHIVSTHLMHMWILKML